MVTGFVSWAEQGDRIKNEKIVRHVKKTRSLGNIKSSVNFSHRLNQLEISLYLIETFLHIKAMQTNGQ